MSAEVQPRVFVLKPQFLNLSKKRDDDMSLMGTLLVVFLKIYIILSCWLTTIAYKSCHPLPNADCYYTVQSHNWKCRGQFALLASFC